ncbi:membrane associated secretion system protein [Vibrio mediterranei]|uniref:tight adherence pilus pseudopilin TadF n=1 Tax=Vibrio mediterranei TaxID=689 RepID=UPI001EFDFBEE|nr:tight adherence pilus pseudopilin TadF [Vibrio mediterranei]MCG9658685.1 membrane associated secretion system protein [Vibrio mediterranei]MCG9661709.1 membrane associated secretion system protein [Vibrio mediterranei]
MKYSRKHQRGTFIIELFFVVIVLIGIFLFMTDLSHKLLVRAQLDRASFALVNILKERARFYNDRLVLNDGDRDDMHTLASRMLNTSEEDIAIRIEALHNTTTVDSYTSVQYGALGCQSTSIDQKPELVPTEDETVYSLYQVSLCEQRRSWFARFWGNNGSPTMTITSSSVVAGR